MHPVTLTTVNWISEADALCVLLQSHGIETFLPDQGMVSVMPIYANAIGGIRIQVDAADLPRARKILEQAHAAPASAVPACPACGSDAVRYERVSKPLAFFSFLLFGLPLLWRKQTYRCERCGHTWEASP